MRAFVLDAPHRILRAADLPTPVPRAGELVVKVSACAVCRTDLHVADGELTHPKLPLVLGHEIIGRVVANGPGAERFPIGARVGIPWLGFTCGACAACVAGRENLCDRAKFTGYDRDGGYAEYARADERFCFDVPASYDDVHAAPLLCAAIIGYRTLRAAGDAKVVGMYGFGAAAHLVAQIAIAQGRTVLAFTRPGDARAQALAKSLGAEWAGSSDERPPRELEAALIFAPVGSLVPLALRAVRKGGTVVCGGIHMSDIPSFPYELLWGERSVQSIANMTRKDGEELMAIAARHPLDVHATPRPLAEAQSALDDLRAGRASGALVLTNR